MGHYFDWHGFLFACGFAVVIGFFGLAIHLGILYAFTDREAEAQAEMVVPSKLEHFSSKDVSAPVASRRVIESLSIAEAVPRDGKFIAADLTAMKLLMYQNGAVVEELNILSKGKPGTSWETPSGYYSIRTKEESHFSTIGHVYMPYSMQFYGNYFIHGWSYYPDGTPVSASFSGGCIRLSTVDAKKVYDFATIGTGIFVYEEEKQKPLDALAVQYLPVPNIRAEAYLVADVDTGDVYAEKNATEPRPIASVTKLMTALVANELISFERSIPIQNVALTAGKGRATSTEEFLVGDLLYPLLLESNNVVADSIARYYGKTPFVGWMNTTAKAFGMQSTTFADPTGASVDNIASADDVYRLLKYLSDRKSFVLSITQVPTKEVRSQSGSLYTVANVNSPVYESPFVGGKAGLTSAAGETMATVVGVNDGDVQRRIAIVVLKSDDRVSDTLSLAKWLTETVAVSERATQLGSPRAVLPVERRKIED
jgi:D-alanyl-D-alanine carboxypeptidase